MIIRARAVDADRVARSLADAARELETGLGDVTARQLAAEAHGRVPVLTGTLAGSIAAVGNVVTVGVVYGGPIIGGWRAHGIEPHPGVLLLAKQEDRWAGVMERREIQPLLDQI